MSIAKRERNLNVDVLKAFTILAVVLYHLGSNILPFGYLGVDIFFVISGFFIMEGMQRAYKNSRKHHVYKWDKNFKKDCRHLTQFGAQFFAAKLDLSWILE